MRRGFEASDPSAGEPVGQLLNSQGLVSGKAGASDEPVHDARLSQIALSSGSSSKSKLLWGGEPVPDLLSAGAERTTEFPARVSLS